MVGDTVFGAINEIKSMLTHAALIALQGLGVVQANVVVADADTEVAEDYVMRPDLDAMIAEHDSWSGGVLAINGEEGFLDGESGFQRNRAARAENDGARSGGFHRSTQTAGSGIVRIIYVNSAAASASGSKGAETFGTGKGGFAVRFC